MRGVAWSDGCGRSPLDFEFVHGVALSDFLQC